MRIMEKLEERRGKSQEKFPEKFPENPRKNLRKNLNWLLTNYPLPHYCIKFLMRYLFVRKVDFIIIFAL
jgi:hypothetical protein